MREGSFEKYVLPSCSQSMKDFSFEIALNKLRFFARHGVLDFERESGNEFIVDLSVRIPFDKRIVDDELEGTVSYADLYEIVKEEMEVPRKLLEKVANEIAIRIKEKFPEVTMGFIKIEKVRPPIPTLLGSASVTLNF